MSTASPVVALRPRRGVRRVALLGVLIVGVAAIAGCGGGNTDGAVDYAASDLRTGAPVSAAALRGRPAVLVSWATWCNECDEVLDSVRELSVSSQAEGLEVVAVNLDAASVEDEIDAKLERHDVRATLWRDKKNAFKRAFGALGVPTVVVLDGRGAVVRTFPGAVDFGDAEVRAALEEARRA